MKGCELCSAPARMYCESDQASLCWECDSRVHSANFLVARHLRTLLCHACQSSTPWKASGSKLGPTVSVCVECVHGTSEGANEDEAEDSNQNRDDEDDDDEDGTDREHDSDDDSDSNSDENEDEDEDADNQVVPWSSSTPPPPPPLASSSSSEDSSSRFSFSGGAAGARSAAGLPTKRMRVGSDLASQDNFDLDFSCSSSQQNPITQIPTLSSNNNSVRLVSNRKRVLMTDSNPLLILNSIRRFEQKLVSGNNTSAMILEMCKLSEDPSRAVDL